MCLSLAATSCKRREAPRSERVAASPARPPSSTGLTDVVKRSATATAEAARAGCLTFAGDLMLSRGVARAMERESAAPWAGLADGEPWVANLEGTLADDASGRALGCAKRADLCLGIAPRHLARLRGGPFVALSLANNHAGDFGEGARQATARALRVHGMEPLLESVGPTRVTIQDHEWALIALNFINREPVEVQRALEEARLAIGLARARTPRVAVLPHWGREYDARVWPQEEHAARLFRAWGATVVAGAHTHVIGESRCERDAALYFGLGNLLFDQRAPEQRSGLAVRCCPIAARTEGAKATSRVPARPPARDSTGPVKTPRDDRRESLACRAARLGVDEDGPAVRWRDEEGAAVAAPRWRAPCQVTTNDFTATERSAWQRHPGAARFVFVQPFRALGAGVYFALHRSHSTFDDELALRPYVFRMTAKGHRDLWSGTALSRPLVAARLFEHDGAQLLCALHRADTFLARDPTTPVRVRRVYRWSGFGFTGVRDERAAARCEAL